MAAAAATAAAPGPAEEEELISFGGPALAVQWDAAAEEAELPESAARRTGTLSASRKNKGRTLQKEGAAAFKAAFPFLQGNDVLSRPMGSPGSDLILSPRALEVLPYDFEMKNVETFSPWATIDQSLRRCEIVADPLTPCIVARRNRIKPMVVLPLGHVMALWRLDAGGAADAPPSPTPFVSVDWLFRAMRVRFNPKQRNTDGELRVAVQLAIKFATRDVDGQGEADAEGRVAARRLRIAVSTKKRMGFWKTWDAEVAAHKKAKGATMPALAFNRGDRSSTPIYLAMPLDEHIRLLQRRWARLHPDDSGLV